MIIDTVIMINNIKDPTGIIIVQQFMDNLTLQLPCQSGALILCWNIVLCDTVINFTLKFITVGP